MKQRILFFYLLVVCFSPAYAQKQGQPLIDSLLIDLASEKYRNAEDTDKVKLLNNLANSYQFINPDEGIKYANQALDMATKLGWKTGIGTAYNRLGNDYFNKSDLVPALENYNKSIKIFEEINNRKMIAGVTNNIGNVFKFRGNYPAALDCYFKALRINEEMGNKMWAGMNIGNIGDL